MIEQLEKGKKVLLLPDVKKVKGVTAGKFFPVFWSPVHFISKDPCGIVCEDRHPVFEKFPTGSYAQYQWKSLLENSFSIAIDSLPAHFEPIVNIIPNFYNNHKSTNLFEATIGNGKILVCSIDLMRDIEDRMEARQLRRSIIEYAASDRFSPLQSLTVEEMKELFTEDDQGSNSGDAKPNLALLKKATSTSEKSLSYSALKGNDGNPTTCWSAADNEKGHWWQVDLGAVYELTGTRVTFVEEANYVYEIMVSNDEENWRWAADQTDKSRKDIVSEAAFDECGRFVRIVYKGFSPGIWAGHTEFEVFGKDETR